eukprot:13865287-Alexandrium_andersonii.AAC.1
MARLGLLPLPGAQGPRVRARARQLPCVRARARVERYQNSWRSWEAPGPPAFRLVLACAVFSASSAGSPCGPQFSACPRG